MDAQSGCLVFPYVSHFDTIFFSAKLRNRMTKRTPSFHLPCNLRWACHFDDDNYVHVAELLRTLKNYDPAYDWYLGKPSTTGPVDLDTAHDKVRLFVALEIQEKTLLGWKCFEFKLCLV